MREDRMPKRYFVITEFGIEKRDVDDTFEADMRRALGQIMSNV